MAMAATVPAISFTQTAKSSIERTPAAEEKIVTSPVAGEKKADEDTSVRPGGQTRSAIPPVVTPEAQINDLRSELLDDRAAYIDRWLGVVAIVLTFFAIVVPIIGFLGFRRFKEIEAEARKSAKSASEDAQKAGILVQEIQRKRDEATDTWRDIIGKAEESTQALATTWHSAGYHLGDTSPEEAISAYDKAIKLNPDDARAFHNRGLTKANLGQRKDAIVDLPPKRSD